MFWKQKKCTNNIGSRVPLQDLVDHSVTRIIEKFEKTKNVKLNGSYTVLFKWGIDGTSDQSRYRQRFQTTECEVTETKLIVSSMVPL